MLRYILIIFFYFLKIIFNINISKQNDPKHIKYIKFFLKKNFNILETFPNGVFSL
jgi:hypothetical protein